MKPVAKCSSIACLSSKLHVLVCGPFTLINANNVDPDQTPFSAASNLIWIYNVCQCPFYATLGINGLEPLLGLSKSGLISGVVLILNIEYSKCPEISNTLFHTFLAKFLLLCICF